MLSGNTWSPSVTSSHWPDRYCIPVDDTRLFTTAENLFFSECGTGSGKIYEYCSTSDIELSIVPVIVIFTKFDALDNKAFRDLRSENYSRKEAKLLAAERATADFERMYAQEIYMKPYPPKGHIYIRGKQIPKELYNFFIILRLLYQI
jgi:hypothetical protein